MLINFKMMYFAEITLGIKINFLILGKNFFS